MSRPRVRWGARESTFAKLVYTRRLTNRHEVIQMAGFISAKKSVILGSRGYDGSGVIMAFRAWEYLCLRGLFSGITVYGRPCLKNGVSVSKH